MKGFKVKLKSIVRYNGKYLLVKKWYDDRINEPYQWEFLDTSLPFGMSPDDAVLEYTASSIGVAADIERILYTWTYTMADTQYVGIAYLCDAQDDTLFLSEEFNEYVWVHMDELKDYVDNKYLLEDILKNLK